jgi:chromosome segregation ATPase
MGGGSSELKSVVGSIGRLVTRMDELESALEKLERMGVLRGHRLVELEKAVNGHDAAITELQDSQRGYVADLQALEERVQGLDTGFDELTAQVGSLDHDLAELEKLEKVRRSAQDDKPKARSKKGGD